MEYELNKGSQLEKEELSLEISFSESITVPPKHRECHKSQRFKKDDSALPVSLSSSSLLYIMTEFLSRTMAILKYVTLKKRKTSLFSKHVLLL